MANYLRLVLLWFESVEGDLGAGRLPPRHVVVNDSRYSLCHAGSTYPRGNLTYETPNFFFEMTFSFSPLQLLSTRHCAGVCQLQLLPLLGACLASNCHASLRYLRCFHRTCSCVLAAVRGAFKQHFLAYILPTYSVLRISLTAGPVRYLWNHKPRC